MAYTEYAFGPSVCSSRVSLFLYRGNSQNQHLIYLKTIRLLEICRNLISFLSHFAFFCCLGGGGGG